MANILVSLMCLYFSIYCTTFSICVANSALLFRQELPRGARDQRRGRERRRAVQGACQEQVWRGRRLHQPQLQP